MEPLVSVVMPAYNAKNIEESIQSVLEQSYSNYELLIIDDCSTDNTIDRIEGFKDERIMLTRLKKNGGVANARNLAIKKAKGTYIAFLDADDIWYPKKLEKQISFMEKKEVLFSYSGYRPFQIVNSNKKIGKIRKTRHSESFESMLKKNGIGCLTVIINSAILKKYEMKQIGHEDYVLWLDILLNENIIAHNTGEVLAEYRVDSNSLSGNKLKAAKWQWLIYREIFDFNLVKSFYYFAHYTYNGLRNSI